VQKYAFNVFVHGHENNTLNQNLHNNIRTA